MEGVALIDVSSEDDLLISSSTESFQLYPQYLENCSESHHDSNHKIEPDNQFKYIIHIPEKSDSPKPKRRASEMYNLRKSLAWDSAFFTSEGVLNPEELAIVNSTFRKDERHELPGIQEDPRRSAESSSTLASDSFTLESLEHDLFDNLRESIQKPYNKHDRTSIIKNLCNPAGSRKPEAQASRKVELPCRNVMKPPIASSKYGSIKQRREESTKEVGRAPLHMKAAAAIGERKSPSRLPYIAPRITSIPNKRASAPLLVQVKSKSGKVLPGNCEALSLPKKVGAVPRSFPSPVSSGSRTPSKLLSTTYYSAYSGSGTSSSDQTNKSSLMTPKRKGDKSSSRISNNAASRVPKSKNIPSDITNSTANSNSIFKFSSSGSPNRSIDSLGSISSSSTASTGRKPMPSTTLNVTPSARLWASSDSDRFSDSPKFKYGRPHDIDSKSGTAFQSHPTNTPSSGVGTTKDSTEMEELGSHSRNNSIEKGLKLSGLRPPTPKIGYFDADKSAVYNSPICSQKNFRSAFNRDYSGSGNLAGVSKMKQGGLQSPLCTNSKSRLNGSPFSSSGVTSSPVSSPKVTVAQTTTESNHGMTSLVQTNISSRTPGKSSLIPKFEAEIIDAVDSLQYVNDFNLNQVFLEYSKSCRVEDRGSSLYREGNFQESRQRASSTGDKLFNLQSSVAPCVVGRHLQKFSFSVTEGDEKENLFPSEEKVCKEQGKVKAEGLKVATIEQLEKRLSSLKLSLSNANAPENAGDLVLFPYNIDLISQKLEFLQNSSNCNGSGLIKFGKGAGETAMDRKRSMLPFLEKGI